MKAQNIKNRWWIHILIISSLLLVTLSTNIQADCRLLGMVAKGNCYLYTETDMVEDLLDELQEQGGGPTYPYNIDGWGLLFYRNGNDVVWNPDIWRDADPAWNDGDYDAFQINFVDQAIEAVIGVGHVRNATNVTGIPDPHPFVWRYEPYAYPFDPPGFQFSFAHNGTVDKDYITWQIDGFSNDFRSWCQENGFEPQMFGGTGDWWNNLNHVVDTEIYFFLVMWRIYLNDGDIISGIHEALNIISDIPYSVEDHTAKNFIFSKDTGIYAYKEVVTGNPHPDWYRLYYFNNPDEYNIFAVMSDPPDPETLWTDISDSTLVYLPRVGNATAFENFVDNDLFVHHLKGGPGIRWNWVSFPVMEEIEPVGTNALEVLQPILDPDILEEVVYQNDPVIWYNDEILDWVNELEDENFHTIKGYKIKMNQSAVLPVSGILEDPDIVFNLEAEQDNWIGYFLPYSQTPEDAFASIWNNLTFIKADGWGLIRIGDETWIGERDDLSVDYGKLYIVGVVRDCIFTWGDWHHPRQPYERTMPEIFNYQDKADYMPVFVDSTEALNGIDEISVFLGDECIGASKIEGFPVFIQAYIEDEDSTGSKDYNELTFQVASYGKSGKRSIPAFVYNKTQDAFVQESVILDKDRYAVVRLGTVEGIEFPKEFVLYQNYPNPMRTSTTISFSLHRGDTKDADINIYNIKGQLVRTLTPMTNDQCQMTNVVWDGKDNNGSQLSNGIYFYKLISGEKIAVKKIVLMR